MPLSGRNPKTWEELQPFDSAFTFHETVEDSDRITEVSQAVFRDHRFPCLRDDPQLPISIDLFSNKVLILSLENCYLSLVEGRIFRTKEDVALVQARLHANVSTVIEHIPR